MVTSTSWFAMTPGNLLPIPTSLTSGAETSCSAAGAAAATWNLRSRRTGGAGSTVERGMRPAREQVTPGPDALVLGGAVGSDHVDPSRRARITEWSGP